MNEAAVNVGRMAMRSELAATTAASWKLPTCNRPRVGNQTGRPRYVPASSS
jgi:hypothetical protein